MEINCIEPFLHYWQNVRKRTMRVARKVPEKQFDWRPKDGAFSFADQLRHLASIERWMFTENAHRRPSRYPGHGDHLAEGYAQVFAYAEQMHADSTTLLADLTPEDLAAKCLTPAGAEITVWKWLRAMVEHEAHHRAQIYMGLTILGVPSPPLYGLTSEEVHERSEP